MRPYSNISDSELETLGALREWKPDMIRESKLPLQVIWVHTRREKFHPLDLLDRRLIRTVTIFRLQGEVLKTDFGSYALATGKNLFTPCGCKKFCDCYGQLYQLKNSSHNV